MITDVSNTILEQQRYLPFGAVRTDDFSGDNSISETDFGYTGQRSLDQQGNEAIGLVDYHARMMDPSIGRWLQPDTVIPDYANPQGLNRFTYTLENPIRYSDPTGHREACGIMGEECDSSKSAFKPSPRARRDDAEAFSKLMDMYNLGWQNALAGARIAYNPNASIGQRLMGAGYNLIWEGAHATVIVGTAAIAADALVGGAVACAADAPCGDQVAQGFETYGKLKQAIGSPGPGMEWHHIVEQSQITKSGFLPEEIQATDNIIAVDSHIHDLITRVYNANVAGPGTGRIRDWLAGQSYQSQYDFGMGVLRNLGVVP